jgi:flagellar hook-basal body complex protein FliE
MPIDPSFTTVGQEWSIAPIEPGAGAAGGTGAAGGAGGGFAGSLADQIGALEKMQTDAATAARALATGQGSPEEAIMAVQRASLGMHFASTMRTKGVEAIQSVFHTQI